MFFSTQRLLTMLIQTESEEAMGKWPNFLMLRLRQWSMKILRKTTDGICDLVQCTVRAHVP